MVEEEGKEVCRVITRMLVYQSMENRQNTNVSWDISFKYITQTITGVPKSDSSRTLKFEIIVLWCYLQMTEPY